MVKLTLTQKVMVPWLMPPVMMKVTMKMKMKTKKKNLCFKQYKLYAILMMQLNVKKYYVIKMQDVVSMMIVLIVQWLILMLLTLKIAFQKNLCSEVVIQMVLKIKLTVLRLLLKDNQNMVIIQDLKVTMKKNLKVTMMKNLKVTMMKLKRKKKKKKDSGSNKIQLIHVNVHSNALNLTHITQTMKKSLKVNITAV